MRFVFYAEILDVRQKWRDNNFGEKSPVESENTWGGKNIAEIGLFQTISEINAFLCFMQKFKMSAKNGGIMIFGKSRQ